MSGVNVTIKDSGELKLFRELNFEMTVGIHPEAAAVPHANGRGLTVGQVAEINEYGAGKVPARFWLRGWADKHGPRYAARIRKELLAMAKTQDYKTGGLEMLTRTLALSMRGVIYGGHIKPPNRPATLARKSPETRPLIETRQFVRAIASKFRWGKK